MDNAVIRDEFMMLKNFFAKKDRTKYSSLFKTKNGRVRFVKKLAHDNIFDPKFLRKLEPNERSEIKILSILHKKGSSDDCYVISDLTTLDSKKMPIKDALDKVVGFGYGTILCCIPQQLLYYQREYPGERYIVEIKNGD